MHTKCILFWVKYLGRISVLPDYSRDYGCYLIRNIEQFHINIKNIKGCYSEHRHELHHEFVTVRIPLDFLNVGTKLWPAACQVETTFRRMTLFAFVNTEANCKQQ